MNATWSRLRAEAVYLLPSWLRPGGVPITRRILRNGYLPEQVFEERAFRTDPRF